MYKSVYVADYVCGQHTHMHKLWTHTYTQTQAFQRMFRLSILPDRSWHPSLCWFSVSLMKQIQHCSTPLTHIYAYTLPQATIITRVLKVNYVFVLSAYKFWLFLCQFKKLLVIQTSYRLIKTYFMSVSVTISQLGVVQLWNLTTSDEKLNFLAHFSLWKTQKHVVYWNKAWITKQQS